MEDAVREALAGIWDRLPAATQQVMVAAVREAGDPPPAQLMSADPGNGQPHIPWLSVDSLGNLYVYGNLVSSSGAPGASQVAPSGDTSGATDPIAIQNALNANAGGTVYIGGAYYLNAPITIPPYTALAGIPNTSQVSQHLAGATLTVVNSFTGLTITDGGPVTLKAAILLLGQSFGGYSTVSEEQLVQNIMVEGSAGPASVSGLQSYGRLQRVRQYYMHYDQMTGDGVVQTKDGSGNGADAWEGIRVNPRFGAGRGFNVHSADSTWLNCKSSNNGSTDCDWLINTCSNSKFTNCASEHSAGIGFGYICTNSGNDAGRVLFLGCFTDQSAFHGWQFGGTLGGTASFAHAFPVDVVGCLAGRDGQNSGSGGNYAGFYVHGYGTTSGGLVNFSGCHTYPGVNDNGSGALAPKYGTWIDGGSNVSLSGSSFFAATGGTAIFDDSGGGGNTINYDNSVTIGVGATGTMAVNMTPNVAQYQGAGMTLTPAAAPSNDPLRIINANSGERSFGIRVAGQNNDKIKVTSDGKIAFGPGSATQDVAVARTSTGILSGTDNGAGNSIQLRMAASASQAGNTSLFVAQPNSSGDNAISTIISGDTFSRYIVDSNGGQQWGSGAATQDCFLSRQGANILQVLAADLDIATAGKGLRIKEGSNAKMGTATANGTSEVTVMTSAVTSSSRILLTAQTAGAGPGTLYVSSRSGGSSFGFKSTNAADTSTVAWLIVEPG
jgi:hypothetical protein